MVNTKKRSILKAISWRVFAAILLGAITWALTSDMKTVTYVTLGYQGTQVFIYYLHERVWGNVGWGKARGISIQMTGMSGAGKSTLATMVADRMRGNGYQVEVIDGDEYKAGICNDLGFSQEDRNTSIRRLGFVSKVLARNNVISIIAAINPCNDVREELTMLSPSAKTVYVKCGLETLKKRDTKGLYRRALLPDGDPEKVHNFMGVPGSFEVPTSPDLLIQTDLELVEESARKLEDYITAWSCN